MVEQPKKKLYKKIGIYAYSEEDILGSGGFGKVYKGKNIEDETVVAIKQIPIPKESYEHFQAKIEREMSSMIDLTHNSVLRYIDSRITENNFYFITEFCNGGDLGKLQGKLNFRNALTILKQITIAMKYANSKGFIHRDLKPQNILVHEKTIKIGDFGLARFIADKMTQEVGTAAYMAPEVFETGKYEEKCDVWSTGNIFFLG